MSAPHSSGARERSSARELSLIPKKDFFDSCSYRKDAALHKRVWAKTVSLSRATAYCRNSSLCQDGRPPSVGGGSRGTKKFGMPTNASHVWCQENPTAKARSLSWAGQRLAHHAALAWLGRNSTHSHSIGARAGRPRRCRSAAAARSGSTGER
jgi:hypothetical protein